MLDAYIPWIASENNFVGKKTKNCHISWYFRIFYLYLQDN